MWEYFVNQFNDLTVWLWIAQICGYIAFVLYLIATQKDKKQFTKLSIVVFIFFLLEQVFAFKIGGIITNVISIIRAIVILDYLNKGYDKMPEWKNWVMLGIMWASCIVVFIVVNKCEGWFNCFFPAILATLFALTQNSKKLWILKLGLLINEIGYFGYFMYNNMPLSYLRELILVVACVIGLIKALKIENKTKTIYEVTPILDTLNKKR